MHGFQVNYACFRKFHGHYFCGSWPPQLQPFESSQRGYGQSLVIIVCHDQRLQHLRGHRVLIHSLKFLQLVVAKGYNIWKVTECHIITITSLIIVTWWITISDQFCRHYYPYSDHYGLVTRCNICSAAYLPGPTIVAHASGGLTCTAAAYQTLL